MISHVLTNWPIFRFSKQFTPTRPTLYSVAEYFFERNPEKIGYGIAYIDSESRKQTLTDVLLDI